MTLPLLGVSMLALTGFVGLGIDIGRMQMLQSKLQFSLDAAGLAAGSSLSTENVQTETTKYLNTNFNNYMGSTITGSSVVANSTDTVLTLSATATLPTTFLNVLGIKTMTVTANSQITRAMTGMELVLVLDNTGSMADSAGGSISKISALQTASIALVESLFGGTAVSTSGLLWVGVVPFSQEVNIGTGHPSWMNTTYDKGIDNMLPSQGPGWGPTSWFGCVDARTPPYDTTDDPPSASNTSTLYDESYWPSDNIDYGTPYNNQSNYGWNPWANVSSWKRCHNSSCTTVTGSCSTSGGHTCTPIAYTYESPLDTHNHGPNLWCPQQVTPMTNDSSVIISSINNMQAQGYTVIAQGMQWGWNMLSPRWQGMWGGTMNANGLPLAYNTPHMIKVLVLVTDGENTIDDGAHGAYWFLHNDLTGSTDSNTAVSNLDSKVLQLCTAMKNDGIYIYTIGLGTDGGINTAELQSCATATNYAFLSPTTSQLQTVFSSIGDSLANLRVSK